MLGHLHGLWLRPARAEDDPALAAHIRRPLVAVARLRARQAGFLRRGALMLTGWAGPDCVELWTCDRGTIALHVADHYYAFVSRLADGRVLARRSRVGPEPVAPGEEGFLRELAAHRQALAAAPALALPFEQVEDHAAALRRGWASAGPGALHGRRLLPDPFLLLGLASPLPLLLALGLPGPADLLLVAQMLLVTAALQLACLLGTRCRSRATLRELARAAAGMRAGLLR